MNNLVVRARKLSWIDRIPQCIQYGFVLLKPRSIKGARSVAGSKAPPKKGGKSKSPKKGSGKTRKGGKNGRA